ncbi:hypothetical protein GCM10010112_78640 [Actinoplanes lobatus]|uniref:Uncharacterized protein n=1 Tax=Actinoplanes lobatus TaxID=113568 RepID=A0ABQ4AAG6_9ACTN|nr:hypothetical protein GCM10010112_78640 [Actinoplanes lobatus]GIE38002.1 hypothetical protein Alo02nite_09000 [Actinoplanes lobatus]
MLGKQDRDHLLRVTGVTVGSGSPGAWEATPLPAAQGDPGPPRVGADAPAVTGGKEGRGTPAGLPGHRSTPGGRGKGGSGQQASADRTGQP